MTANEQPPPTYTTDPEFTEEELAAAVGVPSGGSTTAVIDVLYRNRGLHFLDYARTSQAVSDRIQQQVLEAITRYRGLYCLVSPVGSISTETYHGLPAAETAVSLSGHSWQAVLLVDPREKTPQAAARFLKLFAHNETMADRLLNRMLELKRPDAPHLRDSLHRQWALKDGRKLLAAETASD